MMPWFLSLLLAWFLQGTLLAQMFPVPGPGRAPAGGGGGGAIAVNATTGSFTLATTTATLSHTPAGTNRLLVVCVGFEAGDTISSVTFGGTALTQRIRSSSSGGTSELWSLVAPAASTANVVVTTATSRPLLGVIATSLTGVNQATPHGTPVGANAFVPPNIATVDVTSATGELVLDCVWDSCCSALTIGAGQTQRSNQYDPSTTGQTVATSTEPGAATVTMSWTGVDAQWALTAIPIKP